MRYALNQLRERIEVEYSGQKAWCGICCSEVIGRKGEIREKHWAHSKKKDCDNWWEPITEWHLEWQNHFPPQNREVIISEGGKTHRADIRLNNGMVIEIQHSPINPADINAREEFYGRNNMIWILDGVSLAKHSELQWEVHPYRYFFSIEFPQYLPNTHDYLTEEFYCKLKDLFDAEYPQYTIKCGSGKLKISDLNEIEYGATQFKYFCTEVFENLYGVRDREKFRKGMKTGDCFERVDKKVYSLRKKYWRKFIDCMQFPVFIDGIKGLQSDEILWYQKRKVYKKADLIEKYTSRK